MAIGRDGNVGINTEKNSVANPQKALHVEHAAGASEGILISGNSDTTGHTAGILLRAEGGEQDSSLRAKGGIFFERKGTYGVGDLHLANDNAADNNSAAVADAKLTVKQNGAVITPGNHAFNFRANTPNSPTYGNRIVFSNVLSGNSGGCYNASNGIYTASVAAWYLVSVGIRVDAFSFGANTDYMRFPMWATISGTVYYPHTGGWIDPIISGNDFDANGNYLHTAYTVPIYLNVNDTVQIRNSSNSGVSATLNSAESHFGMLIMG